MAAPVTLFIDRHPLDHVPAHVRMRLFIEARHGIADPTGALPLSTWIADGYLYCVLSAPDRKAVVVHHAVRQLDANDLHAVTEHPYVGEAIRNTIIALWPR